MEIPLRRTHARIDLDAVEQNIRELWEGVGREKGLMVLLKADAYGHGSTAIARLVDGTPGAWGGVANLEEALFLRKAGVRMPLLLLEDVFPEAVEPALRLDLRLTASSVAFVRHVSGVAQVSRLTARVHVNVDSGMGRLGVPVDRAESVIHDIGRLPNVILEGIYTHFAVSDEADKRYSQEQLRRFGGLLENLRDRGISPPVVHAANSGAVIDFPGESAFSLVRPGIAVYGLYPSAEVRRHPPLRPAMELRSALIKVARYPAGHSIGYGRTFTTKRPTVLGIVPIGYGDGYLRALSNAAEMVVAGRRVPVIGRVSMDLTALDLTDLPREPRVGDPVVVFGAQVTVDELARKAGTIPYEIVTLLTRRIPRLYYRHGSVVSRQTLSGGYDELAAMEFEGKGNG